MHREILGLQKGEHTDHINGDGLDNRRANLRKVTHAQNMQNRRPHCHGRSRYRGVERDSRNGKWRARLTVNGRRLSVGSFHDEKDAAAAASAARTRLMPFTVESRCSA